jgi:hypothetical protein
MAPLTGPGKGVIFLKGHISLKNGTFCPLFSHDSTSFKRTCFLIGENERKLLCMGRTSTANKPLFLYYCPKQLNFQLGIEPGK